MGLARRKVPTLLIDLDPQANATSGLGYEKEPGGSLYEALHGEGTAAEKILQTREKHLSLIPSEVDLAAIEMELGQREDYLVQLKQVLDPVLETNEFSAVIIDCPPALGMISMNSLVLADYLIVALQCEYLALEGLGQILSVVEQLKEAEVNEKLEVGGILMTMYDSRTKLSKEVVDEVRGYRPDLIFKTIIPRTVRLSEAPSFGKSIFEHARLNPGAFAYGKFAKEVIDRFGLEKAGS